MILSDDGSDCEDLSPETEAFFTQSLIFKLFAFFYRPTPTTLTDSPNFYYATLEEGEGLENRPSDDNNSTNEADAATESTTTTGPISTGHDDNLEEGRRDQTSDGNDSTLPTQPTEPKVSNSFECDLFYAVVGVFGFLILSTVIGVIGGIISCSKGECNTDDNYTNSTQLT